MAKYNVIVASQVGTFIINKNDMGVGRQLAELGSYDRYEMLFIADLMKMMRDARENLVALDVGANIGVHSIFLSNEVGLAGKVYAFEAQRIVFNMLAGNMAINSVNNVYCAHNAVSDSIGAIDIPQFDYASPLNVGSVEFGGTQNEFVGQNPQTAREKVATVTIDSLDFETVDFLKIDVEGMELNVLRGAAGTIARCKPIILVEFLKSDDISLSSWLSDAGYRVYCGPCIGDNFACIPREFDVTFSGMTEVARGAKVSR